MRSGYYSRLLLSHSVNERMMWNIRHFISSFARARINTTRMNPCQEQQVATTFPLLLFFVCRLICLVALAAHW